MTRIFTNVPSLTAQRALQQNMSSLETSLQRLSTGLRINSGKDDPAGLIASEMLRSEITGIKQGITNTERANNMIATADSALNEIAGLLNSIRGLVNEAANTGAMSLEMIKANQEQVNMMLKSIDQISANTSFMGRKLLDGSLDFEIQNVNRSAVQNLSVTEAQFGDKGSIDVQVTVREAAEKAALYYEHSVAAGDVVLNVGGNLGRVVQTFAKGTTVAEIAEWVNNTSSATGVIANVLSDATYGTLVTSSVGPNNDIVIQAGGTGQDAGFVEIKYSYGNDRGLVVDYTESLGPGYPATINVLLQTSAWEAARATHVDSTFGIHDNNSLEFIANISGEKYNGVTINYVDGNLTDSRFADASQNPSGVSRGVNTWYSDVATASTAVLGDINGLKGFTNAIEGEFLKFTATQAGSAMNDVRIEFVNDASRINIPPGTNAFVTMTTDQFDSTQKVLRIFVDASATVPGSHATTFAEIKTAVAAEGSFNVEIVSPEMANRTIAVADTVDGSNAVYGNTHKSGGDAETLFVSLNTADPPAYMGLALNKPVSDFENFDPATDSFFMETTKAGYNNVQLNMTVAATGDDMWATAPAGQNVLARYDSATNKLNVYIRSQDEFVPPLESGSGIFPVTFEDVKTAIDNASGADPGTFIVTLGGTAATKEVSVNDLTFQKPLEIPLTGLTGDQAVYVRDQTGSSVEKIRFVQSDTTTATYDQFTKQVTVNVAAGADLAAIDTALKNLEIEYPPGSGTLVKPFALDRVGTSLPTAFDMADAIPGGLITKGTAITPGTLSLGLTATSPTGAVSIKSEFTGADVELQFIAVDASESQAMPPGRKVQAVFSNCEPHTLTVYVRKDQSGDALVPITLDELDKALLEAKVPVETVGETTYRDGVFYLDFADPTDRDVLFKLGDTGPAGFATRDGMQTGVQYTVGAAHTANDIMNAFDLTRVESQGNERAAGLFTVYRSRDNDGTGAIHGAEFKEILKGGADGGKVLNTAQEVVAALNNSKYWGQEITQELLQKWYSEQSAESRSDPPVITAALAPGNHGLSTVSVFSEVAYYGSPYDGTGLQFLGPSGARPIRFVVDEGAKNSPLSLDWTSIPDEVDYATAILQQTNPNAGVVIQAKQKGEGLDDVVFNFVRVKEDPLANPPIVHGSGWGEYDSGPSFSQTQLTFSNSANGNSIANTAFFITANDRGVESNNVNIVMRQDANQTERVVVNYDSVKGELQISLRSADITAGTADVIRGQITTNEILAAINQDKDGNGLSDCGFNASLSYSLDANNSGNGTFENVGLTTVYRSVGNTGDTGGHNGTVTVYLVGEGTSHTNSPSANQIVNIIQNDDILSTMFTASTYTTGSAAGTGAIDFVKDARIVTEGGISNPGVLVVHLATDANGLPTTTAADLVAFWDTLTAEESHGISASLLRETGANWDICNDTDGRGILQPTPRIGNECDDDSYLDTYFVGWSDVEDEPYEFIPTYSTGSMTSINGENSNFDLKARRTGSAYDGYTLVYQEDPTLTGRYDDNITGTDGTILYNGIKLSLDEKTKQITVFILEGVTTANDIKQLIETNAKTRSLFEVVLKGDGTGKVTLRDDTLKTTGGTEPPSSLNGAKLLFGRDASEFALEFLSAAYGSNQYVDVIATEGEFLVQDSSGKLTERTYGKDSDVLVNGVKAVSDGLNVGLSTSTMSMDFTLNENLETGYTTNFTVAGGGATFQIGPQVVSNQQITIGIQSVNTVSLGGPSGKMYQLRSGGDASLMTSEGAKLADKIVQEAIVNITSIRGRLGSIQKNLFEPNVNVLSDTLEALSTAESQIRDTDFAEETSNLTRDQVLVQASINTLGIANQLPNYILGLLGG